MSRLFISHSSANNAIALALGQWLESQGWSDYFLDVHVDRGIAPGERWMAALTGAVDRCEAVLFVVSKAWLTSDYCKAELYWAKGLGKRLFGLIVEPIDPNDLPAHMTAEWQVCDLCHADESVTFSVERPPLLPRTDVAFPKAGLDALARGLRKAGLDPATFEWPPAGEPDRSPYPGLRALDRADAAVFFGREAAIVRGIDQIRLTGERGVEPLFVILGASGAGKSSFLRAGLLPRLARDSDHFIVLPTLRCERAALSGPAGLWAVLRQALEQADQPMSLAQVREAVAAQGLGRVLQRLRGGPEVQSRSTGEADSADARTLVVPIDQFEELFATDGQAEATEFLQLITQALPAAGSAVRPGAGRLLLLVTIRSDALPTLQSHPLLRELKPVLFSLPAMAPSNFKDVIEGPARRHSEKHRLNIDPALTEALLEDAQGPDALPLLALTLEWLLRDFGQREGTELGLTQYETIGRVGGVIDRAVQRALAQPDHPPAIPRTPAEQDALLHRLFGFIATVDPDTKHPKRRVALRSDLRQALGAEGDALISRLVEQRLLVSDARVSESGGAAAETVEIAHEALLRQWRVMQRWLAEMAERLTAVESLRRCAADWLRSERDEALLVHTRHRLSETEALRQDEQLQHRLDAADAEYLEACRTRDARIAHEREEQQQQIARQQAARARWQRRFAWVLGLAFVGVAILLGWIINQTREVSIQTSVVLSAAAERAADDGHFDRAVRLGVLAARSSWLYPHQPEARGPLVRAVGGNSQLALYEHSDSVQSAVFSPDGQRMLTVSGDHTARLWDVQTSKPLGSPMEHEDWVGSAVFSTDGQRVLTASRDKTARLWDAQTGQALGSPMKHEGEIQSAVFSPDGQRVLTASRDKTARLWDAQTGQALGSPMKHEGEVQSAVFSPDGQRVLTASHDKTARLWDAQTGQAMGSPMKHAGSVTYAVFSPDGQRVLTVSYDTTARLWNAQTGQALGSPMKHEDIVWSAVFSPDGQRVLTASHDKTAQLWDANTGRAQGSPMKHEGGIDSAVFSPDGQRVLTASEDKTARLWNAQTSRALGSPMKHEGEVRSAVFSPDGQRVLTASYDKTARLWDAQTGQALGSPMKHEGRLPSAVFSLDGQRVLSASEDWTSRLWDAQTGQALGSPMKHKGSVNSAVFSPDGQRVLTASDDTSARLWDARTGHALGSPMKHEGRVHSAVFSPDGRHVLTASYDKTARLWNAQTGQAQGSPMKHEGGIDSAVFSPDGQRVLTASYDKTARLWNAQTGRALGSPMKHEGSVNSAVFSPDGRRVLTASWDKTAQLWDAQTGQALGSPMKHEGKVNSAVFSPDGQRVLTASDDNTARLWDAQTGQALGAPMKHAFTTWSAIFSPDGRRVLTASWDKTAQLWDAQTGQALGSPMKHEDMVWSAVFSPDGQRVLTASLDKNAQLWTVQPSLPSQLNDLIAHACKTLQHGARQITDRDLATSRILPHGFQVGDDVCKGLPAAATTVH